MYFGCFAVEFLWVGGGWIVVDVAIDAVVCVIVVFCGAVVGVVACVWG